MRSKASIFNNSLKIILTVLLLIFLFSAFYRPIETEDIWWHLSTGRWITQNLQVPHYDLFSFTEKPIPWTFTQWLGSTIYYGAYSLGGLLGLRIFRLFLFMLMIGIFFFYAYRKIPYYMLLALVFLLALGLAARALLRPLAFNFIFIEIFLIILYSYKKDPKTKKLLLLLLCGALWSNLHLGSFIYGSLLISIFLFSEILSFFDSILKHQKKISQFFSEKKIKELLLLIPLFWLSFTFSPYGWEATLYPWKVFLLPKFINFYKFNNLVAEMLAPNYLFTLSAYWFYLTAGLAIIFVKLRKQKDLTDIFLLIFAIFFFLYSNRGSAFFSIISVFVITKCASDISLKTSWSRYRFAPTANYAIAGFFLLLLFIQGKFYVETNITKKFVFEKREENFLQSPYTINNPHRAVDFLKKNNISGKMFNNSELGGYVIWSSYPFIKPMVDGRQVHQKIFQDYLTITFNYENFWQKGEEAHGYKIALLNLRGLQFEKIAKYLNSRPDWQLVFIDGFSVAFVKRGFFNLPQEADQFESQLKVINATEEDFKKLQKIASRRKKTSAYVFFPPISFVDTVAESAILLEMGYQGAAVKRIIDETDKLQNTFPVRMAAQFILLDESVKQ
ncbi:MAG: hypothetical protein P9M07_07015 [Candidatus Aceula meridiana]|nr:hypothetical protein [Candidatus Aceula meridiana]